jgi:hypothetical protein
MPHPLQQIDHQFLFEVGSVVLGESGFAARNRLTNQVPWVYFDLK